MGDVIRFPAGRPFEGVRLPAEGSAEGNRLDRAAAVIRAETGCTAERADFVAAQVLQVLEGAAP
ncbi:hypothetical protein GJ689_24665 [Rhodoplanes serenus]|uniref:Uncharacterized protein n=1 Tax=Rhodoplanes serenus TaxID=200615 RepID=A0A9X4XRA3_9BRAD|nr:hypothetical protein [Rhodoplanes serenus]MTW19387.1 hypothetical protein [Rhodoplanes serenus]